MDEPFPENDCLSLTLSFKLRTGHQIEELGPAYEFCYHMNAELPFVSVDLETGFPIQFGLSSRSLTSGSSYPSQR